MHIILVGNVSKSLNLQKTIKKNKMDFFIVYSMLRGTEAVHIWIGADVIIS